MKLKPKNKGVAELKDENLVAVLSLGKEPGAIGGGAESKYEV
jgi:hypothetical protein